MIASSTLYQDAQCSLRDYLHILGFRGVLAAAKSRISGKQVVFRVGRHDVKYPFYVRIHSSDVRTYEQIFIKQEYCFKVKRSPLVIIDAGANTGLASIYFANKFPESKIYAVEPERDNFNLLRKNCTPYPNIVPVFAALWNENHDISLVDPGLGEWGYQTKQNNSAECQSCRPLHVVRGITVDRLMAEYQIEHVDILKIDIEGAEKEVFKDTNGWIGDVDSIIIELHERMQIGCNRSFYNATNGFDDEWLYGENVCLTRRSGCMER